MPKKDFLVTVTVSQKKVTNVAFSTTSTYPDYASNKTKDSKQAEVLAGSIKLELAKQKYDACLAAIKANDQARIKELNCGE